MENDCLVLSLFDQQLDRLERGSARIRAREPRSPILSLAANASPRATRFVIFVSKKQEKAAREAEPELRKEIQKSIVRTISGKNDQRKRLAGIAIKIVPIDYKDIWDLSKCTELFADVLPAELKAANRPKTIIVNLASGTTAARTAFYLNCLKLLREERSPSTMVVATNVATERGRLSLKFKVLSPARPSSVGLLAQSVGTKCAEFAEALDRLESVVAAMRNEKILVVGPTGAGKSELAKLVMSYMKALHRDITDRNCIHLNVAAIAPTLIESELFGHEKNAFTGAEERHIGVFERADGGVVFLDEIGELAPYLQAKLLTVLDGVPFTRVGGEEPVKSDFLLLCGTNVDLQAACEKGGFRRDLYERLRTWTVEVPPIRDRPEDIESALQRETGIWRDRTGIQVDFAGPDGRAFFMDRARRYPWPGNFREFHAAFVHLAMASQNGRIRNGDVEDEFRRMERSRHGSEAGRSGEEADETQAPRTGYDLAELARLACALDACRKCKTASEAGTMVFSARARAAQDNGTLFNGAASLQRLFGQFGLKVLFRNGVCSVQTV